jgi:hypothetical protein
MSVSNTVVVVDRDIPGILPLTVYFGRNTVSLNNWFGAGFSNTSTFRAANCRLSGSLNIRSGFSGIVDGSVAGFDLSRNLINGYFTGSLGKIFSGNSRKITVDFSSNNLPVSDIRDIVSEVSGIDNLRRFQNCLVRLSLNKFTSAAKYSNYTQNEVFPVTLSQGSDIVTSLFRNETFKLYSETIITDDFGNETLVQVQIGTQTIPIPGQLVSGIYYKIRRDTTQIATENPIGIQFKNLRGVKVDLGFTYVTPNTSPIILSTAYEQETTRNQSIIDAGYNPADLVNP